MIGWTTDYQQPCYAPSGSNNTEPHNRMVNPTFSAMLCLQSLTAPPQRVRQVNAYVKQHFLALSNLDRRLLYVLNLAYNK